MLYLYLIAAAVIALLLWYLCRKLRHGGCCGTHEAPVQKHNVTDKDPAHYPFRYTAKIEGMVCGNCARRVENLFAETGQCLARIDLANKTAVVYAKRRTERTDCAKLLESAGFTLVEWEEHHESE